MSATVAIVNFSGVARYDEGVADRLKARELGVVICPEYDVRGAVRWAVSLSADSVDLCVVIDGESSGTGSVVAALDPGIRVVVWALNQSQLPRLAISLAQTSALVSFAESSELVADAIAGVVGATRSATVNPSSEGSVAEQAEEEPAAGNDVVSAVPPAANFDEDYATLQQLEQMMAVARTVVFDQPEPVPVQPKALDFSVSLRELMTAARMVAQSRKAPEVLAVHYLAGVAEQQNVYRDALAHFGIDRVSIGQALESLTDESGATDEPVISDAVFETVSLAKIRARQQGADCIRVYDFLTALFEAPTPAVDALLREVQATPEGVLDYLREVGPTDESVEQPFFRPSSRDQAGFYEFNEEQVQNIASRLEKLPAFLKAAKPAKVKRERREQTATAEEVHVPVPVAGSHAAPPPPDEPELFRVNGDFPSVDVVEQTADLLLEGHLVAFPSDIMLALAADATNPAAVRSLRKVAGISDDKPLGILVNSTAQLKHLTQADLDSLEPLFDDAWPGPLTLIFQAATGAGGYVAHNESIAVRQPGDSISLAILSMLGRPLAVTSWDADAAELNGKVAAVIRSGEDPPNVRTTILDVRQIPWNVLREGAVSGDDVLKFQP